MSDEIPIINKELSEISYWFKDYPGLNFGQQMAVLQNQWRVKGTKIVDKTHAISMRKICTSCDKPNVRTYDLRVVVPRSAEKQKNAPKCYRDLQKQRA